MRHWLQLGTRNWLVKPGRTAGALAAIALGVGVVVWVTCAYESVRLALQDQVWFWIGRSHLSVESVYGMYGSIPQAIAEEVAGDPNVAAVTARMKHGMRLLPLGQRAGTGPAPASGPAPGTQPASAGGAPSVREQVFELVAPPRQVQAGAQGVMVQAVGIDPLTEAPFRPYDESTIIGRMLRPGDTNVAVIDAEMADALGLGLQDRFVLENVTTGTTAPARERAGVFTIVGLIDMRRVAKKQKPVVIAMIEPVQMLTGKDTPPRQVTRVDMILKDTSPRALGATSSRVQAIVRKNHRSANIIVTSADAKLRQVKAAERQTQFVLLIVSSVALFTAFFVILSTLSMGMVERIGQLGMVRCLGMTRGQVAALVLGEALPLGLVGMLLGIPVGLGLARLSVWMAPEYIGRFAISRSGVLLAMAGGLITTLLGALAPMVQAMRVSPLVASRPQAQHPSRIYVWLAAALGLVMVGGHWYLIQTLPVQKWFQNPAYTVQSVGLLYGGYALIAPALVLVIGQVAVRGASALLGVRHRLLSDQVGRAAWRSAAICSGLMVGLSLIVSIVVYSQSLAGGWDFPKDFCDAFIYVVPPVRYDVANNARKVPGVAQSCLVNEKLQGTARGRGLFDFGLAYIVAGDPDEFFDIARLEFLEGDQKSAVEKLQKGRHVLITKEFSRAQNVSLDDNVRISAAGRTVTFRVAGVVTSPALDIAANFFNAGEALTLASYSVVLATLDDLQRVFGVPKEISMFLINFDLPPSAVPPAFQGDRAPDMDRAGEAARLILGWREGLPERAEELGEIAERLKDAESSGRELSWTESPALRLFREAMQNKLRPGWARIDATQRWRQYREELVMRLVARRAGTAVDQYGSVAALKAQIDRDLWRATVLFSTIPLVARIVAGLGVANPMMANVASRSRQIAMLRAIGATKWQVTRLVIGEALVLALLGSLIGVALGLHAAHGMNVMTTRIWGYAPKWTVPWGWVATGVAFTVGICLLAGILPARRAARNNIIDAMQTT